MRIFTDVLRDIRKGRLVEEATEALSAVVRACDETGKAGTLTISLTVKPSKHGGPEKVIEAKVDGKIPRADIAPAIFFSNEDGDLFRFDPRQEEIPFTEVKKEKA